MHFRVQVNLGNLQRLVPEPVLDLHQVEARAQPVGSRSFPEPVKVMLVAYRASLARYLDFVTVVVSAFTNRNLTLSTIQPSAFGNHFELAEEVAFGFAILVCENPAVGHSVLLVIG